MTWNGKVTQRPQGHIVRRFQPGRVAAVGQPEPKGPHFPARGSAEIDSRRERIGFLIDGCDILRCPPGGPASNREAIRQGMTRETQRCGRVAG